MTDINWTQLRDQIIATLQDLIRFDTTNPPGNETPLVVYIRDRLAAEGIASDLLESAPGRGNVIARLRGNGAERPFLLLSHVDVVAAEAEKWRQPPFSGNLVDGCVWGRGAVDMKGFTAVGLELLLLLKRLDLPLKRDVILAATADEEAGGEYGVGWLAENHYDLIDAEYALNEGGGLAPGPATGGYSVARRRKRAFVGANWLRAESRATAVCRGIIWQSASSPKRWPG